MSVTDKILDAYPDDVRRIAVDREKSLHGEPATEVIVTLIDGRTVTGTFTRQPREGFGGVEGSKPKDVAGLMIAKVRAVLDGKAETTDG